MDQNITEMKEVLLDIREIQEEQAKSLEGINQSLQLLLKLLANKWS